MVFFRRGVRSHGGVRGLDEAGPSETTEVESLHGEVLSSDDVDTLYSERKVEEEEEGDGFNVPFFISLAIFAVSAVFFTVQRFFSSFGGDTKRELPPQKALVMKVPATPAQKMRRAQRGMQSPDCNLTFVVPEDFKLGFVEASQVRDAWQRCMYFVPDECHLVDQLLRAGARCLGKAWTQAVPFNLIETGEDVFRNPEKPGRVTGGEYSGCAVLVRSSEADFAVAVDTVGGVRIAAACCGVIAFKPTYGSALMHGISPKSAALDTVSFMVKEDKYLSRIGEMMDLPGSSNWRGDVVKIFMARDLFARWTESDNKEMVYAVAKAALQWAGQDEVEEVNLNAFLSAHAKGWQEFDSEDVYEALRKVATSIAGYELKCKLLKDCNCSVDESPEEMERYAKALLVRGCVQEAFKQGIRQGKLVMLPGLLRPPPDRKAKEEELKEFELETQRLHALSSLVGCPQIVFPIRNKSRELYSVSMLGLNKTDKQLLAISEQLIPSTYQMLDAEILTQLHRNQQQQQQQLNQSDELSRKFSEAEAEGEEWRQTGNTCYKNSEYDRAVVAYTEAIQRCPYNAVFYSNRAMAYIKLMQFDSAEEDCSKSLIIDSLNPKAFLRRGVARKGMGLYIEAQEDFQKVLLIEPNNRQARTELRELEHFFSHS